MCGLVGLIGSPDAAREAFLGLTTLQHRGQDAAGILTYDEGGFHQVKNLGLAESVFTQENMSTLTGSQAVGHARYSTVGRGDASDVQPLLASYPYGLGLIHNGNIVNHEALATDLKRKSKWNLLTNSDSEILLNLLADGLAQFSGELDFDRICSAVSKVYQKVNGSYSVICLIADHGLLAFRDPYGIRPLVWGRKGKAQMVASETVALYFNGYETVRDLEPGEVLFIDRSGKAHTRVMDFREKRHCMFEWVYFASAESEMDRIPVYGARIQLGKKLAHLVRERLDELGERVDLIAAVPDTARTSATALSEELQVPYREVLIKNRYIKRTFILASEDRRQKAVNLKLSPVRSEIEGKNVLLVDDSIVRGTTSKKIIELVRKAGARKVFFVSTCPPIRKPCFYGIDFPNDQELVAWQRDSKAIEKEIGADAVVYMDLDGLKDSISTAGSEAGVDAPFKPCMACLDGDYPGDVSAGLRFAKTRMQDRETVKRSEVTL